MLGNVARKRGTVVPQKTSNMVADCIEQGLHRSGDDEVFTGDDLWFNPSSVSSLCPRMYALAVLRMATLARNYDARTLLKFEIGNVYHRLFQDGILPGMNGGVFQGTWQRYVPVGRMWKRDIRTGSQNRDNPNIERGWCARPEWDGYPSPRWEYIEPKFRNHDLRIVGKCDGILVWPELTELLEIKTEMLTARDTLDPRLGGKPREFHVDQVNMCLWQLGLEVGRIVYVFKGEDALQSFITEHVVLRDDRWIGGVQQKIKETIGALEKIKALRDDVVFSDTPIVQLLDEIRDDVSRVYGGDGVKPEGEVAETIVDAVPVRLSDCSKRSDARPKRCVMKDFCLPARAPRKKK